MAAMDQSTIDGVNTNFVAREATAGLKVSLLGLGGDELFGGYDTFRTLPKLVEGIGWIPGLGSMGRGFRIVACSTITRFMSSKYARLFEYVTGYGSAYLSKGAFSSRGNFRRCSTRTSPPNDGALDPLVRLDTMTDPHKSPHAKIRALETAWYM